MPDPLLFLVITVTTLAGAADREYAAGLKARIEQQLLEDGVEAFVQVHVVETPERR